MKTATDPVLLLTGFEPFGGERINPSWEVARALHGERIAGTRVVAHQVPCVFGEAIASLRAAIDREQPVLVLSLGQAAGRSDLSLERVGINIDDARIADNAGAQPIDEAVIADAPSAYFATLPIKAMVAAMRDAGFPASVSNSAGTFVCNHLLFGLMHALREAPQVRGGFMHLPLLPEQAARMPGQPSLALATMVDGVRLALLAALKTRHDLRQTQGTIA